MNLTLGLGWTDPGRNIWSTYRLGLSKRLNLLCLPNCHQTLTIFSFLYMQRMVQTTHVEKQILFSQIYLFQCWGSVTFWCGPDPQIRTSDYWIRIRIQLRIRLLSSVTKDAQKKIFRIFFL
jgi:hypothetical protein